MNTHRTEAESGATKARSPYPQWFVRRGWGLPDQNTTGCLQLSLTAVGVMETVKFGCNLIRYDFKTEYYRKKEYRSQSRDSEGGQGTVSELCGRQTRPGSSGNFQEECCGLYL